MKGRVKRLVVIFVLLSLVSGSLATGVFAQDPIRKLGRGLANLSTGFLEVPINIVDAAEEEGFIAATTYGLVRGLAMALLRTGIGVYETVTFLIPLPWRYEPILEPEFLMSEERF